MPVFTVTKENIKTLDDAALRELVARLCMAELYAQGIADGVRWGGNQDAPDGGIDVLVDVPFKELRVGSFIKSPYTSFQVKKPSMPPKDIEKEMCPKGVLRPVFSEINKQNGAYIIASGTDDVTEKARDARIKKMKEVLNRSEFKNVIVDFFDSQRIANWVNCYPAICIYVLHKLGKGVSGWRPYGNWSSNPVGEEYLIDDESSNICHGSVELRIIDAIQKMRELLLEPKASLRLVGLSGMGKTRLLQTLFDERVGKNALSKELVIYGDIGATLGPSPETLAERLIGEGKPVILAVDNCSPQQHKNLTAICTCESSPVSLITVEYDVRDDQPEDTEVFRLEPSSDRLITRLLHARYLELSYDSARHIAEHSAGNWRMANAIAKRMHPGESAIALNDADLFDRLFWQRGQKDEQLLRVAEVCSLVYSFGTEDNGHICKREYPVLADIIGVNEDEFYRYAREIFDRELMQRRGDWYAVMPHVLASNLAKRALQRIPLEKVEDAILVEGNERLIVDFTRRLAFLHNSPEAVKIVRRWLAADGLLANVFHLNDRGLTLLDNITPVIPSEVLHIIYSNYQEQEMDYSYRQDKYSSIIEKIAYDEALFEQCMEILTWFALSEKAHPRKIDKLKKFFRCFGSGTLATWEQKRNIVHSLIDSEEPKRQALGIKLLCEMFSANLSGWSVSDFGSHIRDGGIWWETDDDLVQWYCKSYDYAIEAIKQYPAHKDEILDVLASDMRVTWFHRSSLRDSLRSEILRLVEQIRSFTFWPRAVTEMNLTMNMFYDKDEENKKDDVTGKELAEKIITILAPQNDMEWVALVTSSYRWDNVFRDEDEGIEAFSVDLGKRVGNSLGSLKPIVEFCCKGTGLGAVYFGRGLVQSSIDIEKAWKCIREQLKKMKPHKRSASIVGGIIHELFETNAELAKRILYEIADNPIINHLWPMLAWNFFDKVPFQKIIEFIQKSDLDEDSYTYMANNILKKCPDEITAFFDALLEKPNGVKAGIKILWANVLHCHKNSTMPLNLQEIGHQLLLLYDYDDSWESRDGADDIFKACEKLYTTDESKYQEMLIHMCELSDTWALRGKNSIILSGLAKINPTAFLDVFMREKEDDDDALRRRMDCFPSALSSVEDKCLIDWVIANPDKKEQLTCAVFPFRKNESESFEWTPIATHLIEDTKQPAVVLKVFVDRFFPQSWSGDRAPAVKPLRVLLEQLLEHPSAIIKVAAKDALKSFEERLKGVIQFDKDREEERRHLAERF